MPPRLARSSIAVAAPKTAKNKSKKRNLNAYSIASHTIKPSRIAKHRLGESLDDNPRQKRRKTDSGDDKVDEEEEDVSEDDSTPRRKLPKSRGRGLAAEGNEDGVEEGSDSEGNEWVLGGLAEGDEDSDLDSDEAFGESDEERFEGFAFRGSSSGKGVIKKRKEGKKSSGEVDLDEAEHSSGEDDEEDDFGDEGVDLATMLDDENADMESADDDEDEENESEDEDISEPDSEEDDGANDQERLARFRDRMEALDASEQPTQTLPDAEDVGGISLEDLLTDMDPAEKKQFTTAIKPRKKSKVPQKLTAPLPKRHQDRLDREIANQKAKEQLDRWRDTVIQNRRAEFLTFPLVDPTRTEPMGKDKFVTDGKPQGQLEENIRKIMEESGMTAPRPGAEIVGDGEDEIMQAEELGTNHLPVEEVMQRRAELRRNRELLFREEIKARRISKIKSKAYRRVHRRERERLAGRERSLMDPEGLGVEMDEGEKERNERKRAEERMSTKHRDSKFGRAMRGTNRMVWDEGAREGVLEQARRKEELRRRVGGEDVGGEGGGGGDSDDDYDGEVEGEDDAAALRRLRGEGEGDAELKGVGGMKFMRDAEDRLRKRNEEDIERMRRDMAVAEGDEDGSDDAAEQEEGGLGRAIFGPKGREDGKRKAVKQKKPEMEEGEMSGEEEGVEAESEAAATVGKEKAPLKSAMKKSAAASGPLSRAALGRDRREPGAASVQPEKESVGLSSAWLNGENAKKGKQDRRKQRSAIPAETIDLSTDLTVGGKEGAQGKTVSAKSAAAVKPSANDKPAGNTNGWQTVPYSNGGGDNDETATTSDAEEAAIADPILTASEQKTAYHRRAFAGDDVEIAFQAEKEADIADQDEQETSSHLPGWGSWTGTGLSKKIRKANAKAVHNPLFKRKLPGGGVKAEERKDGRVGMEKVIVSEKTERKGKKYLAAVLPREYENGAQYERALRGPVGPEWTTKEVFQRGTRPRVLVKGGVVVGAMERPLV
ncbi:hypothetical protein LTR78_004188 [Recurvomyces mirabilis]|uniref:U3 small nucleolar RNA-associated protein 14 n=1 Tax=Recurvomyces mirabilis TaxID=574656 RepID=A0AAE0WQG7_9PEZI|nr:hypothetical protein LTR78_004188 [Recurvomyces mirabilis]KAK5153642.1 hypothetical protein LTS14_007336 [Recurvomyces mirabilis]